MPSSLNCHLKSQNKKNCTLSSQYTVAPSTGIRSSLLISDGARRVGDFKGRRCCLLMCPLCAIISVERSSSIPFPQLLGDHTEIHWLLRYLALNGEISRSEPFWIPVGGQSAVALGRLEIIKINLLWSAVIVEVSYNEMGPAVYRQAVWERWAKSRIFPVQNDLWGAASLETAG